MLVFKCALGIIGLHVCKTAKKKVEEPFFFLSVVFFFSFVRFLRRLTDRKTKQHNGAQNASRSQCSSVGEDV